MKNFYRVYDGYCTIDSFLYTENENVAKHFIEEFSKANPDQLLKYEKLMLEVPLYEEDAVFMPPVDKKSAPMNGGWL